MHMDFIDKKKYMWNSLSLSFIMIRGRPIIGLADELIKSRSVHLNRLALWTSIYKY